MFSVAEVQTIAPTAGLGEEANSRRETATGAVNPPVRWLAPRRLVGAVVDQGAAAG